MKKTWFSCTFFLFTVLLSVSLADGTGAKESSATIPDTKFLGKGLNLLKAAQITLANDPNIRLQEKNVEISKGKLQAARGQFDVTLQSSFARTRDNVPLTEADKIVYGVSQDRTDETAASLGVSKQFRSGAVITPGIEITKSNNIDDDDVPANRAEVSFTIELPLLRGRGKAAAGANEMAAEIDCKASRLDLRHTISGRVLNTVSAYWNYLAGKKRFDILKESETRAGILVKETEILVKADEIPAGDIKQLLANLAGKTAERIEAEQNLFEARQNIGLAMGIPSGEIVSLPLPSDEFPKIGKQDLQVKVSVFTDEALKRRADLLASKEREKSAEVLLKAAKLGLRPQLDLSFGFGYAGLDEGEETGDFFSALSNDESDLNASASIGGEWPITNNSNRGILVQMESVYQQQVIQTGNLKREINSNVAVAESALRNSIRELTKCQEAIHLYQMAVDNEKEKLKLGDSTLIDVVAIEDRLTNVLINKVSVQIQCANALANLRFETGTLLSPDEEEISVGMQELTSVPFTDR